MATTAPSPEPRMAGLPADAIARMHGAARAIRDGACPTPSRLLANVLAQFPEHPEALRLLALLRGRAATRSGRYSCCSARSHRFPETRCCSTTWATCRWPVAMPMPHSRVARRLHRAPEQPMPWFNLGRNLQLQGDSEAAVEALERACMLAPDLLPATILCWAMHWCTWAGSTRRRRVIVRPCA